MKKLLLTVGSVSSIVVPIISVVSCGAVAFDGVAWDRDAKTLYFNLSGSTSSGDFKGMFANGGKLGKADLSKLDSAVDKALGLSKNDKTAADNVRDNNVIEIDVNGKEEIKMTFTGEFTWDDSNDKDATGKAISKTTRFTQSIKFMIDNIKSGERTIGNSQSKVNFGFISTGSSKTKQIPLKTNFAFALIEGLHKQGFIKPITNGTGLVANKEYESLIWDVFVKGKDIELDNDKILAKANAAKKDLTKSVTFDDVDLTKLKVN